MFNYNRLDNFYFIRYKDKDVTINSLTVSLINTMFKIDKKKIIYDLQKCNWIENDWGMVVFGNIKDTILYIELLESYKTICSLSM